MNEVKRKRRAWGYYTRDRGWTEEDKLALLPKPEQPIGKIGDFPDKEHVKSVCKIGQGHDCCRYLTMAPLGWSCEKRGALKKYLDMRVATAGMVARGDNCEGKDAR